MATARVRYVNTASSGGDGTTNATSGATAAYATLNAAIAAERTALPDLVTADVYLDIQCSGSTADTGGDTSIYGFTTDTTHYVQVRTVGSNRHGGYWDTTKYRLQSNGYGALAIGQNASTPQHHVRLLGLQVMVTVNDAGMKGIEVLASSADCYVGYNIVTRKVQSYTYGWNCQAISQPNDSTVGSNYYYNNVIWNWSFGTTSTQYGTWGIYITFMNAGGAYVYNNTVYGCLGYTDAAAYRKDYGGTCSWKNNIAANSTAAFTSGTGDYNATDLSTATGGTHDRTSQTFSFVDATNGNFQPTSSDTGAKGFGVDLSADANLAFSDDIVGNTRSTPWDIGAWKAAGGGAVAKASYLAMIGVG